METSGFYHFLQFHVLVKQGNYIQCLTVANWAFGYSVQTFETFYVIFDLIQFRFFNWSIVLFAVSVIQLTTESNFLNWIIGKCEFSMSSISEWENRKLSQEI